VKQSFSGNRFKEDCEVETTVKRILIKQDTFFANKDLQARLTVWYIFQVWLGLRGNEVGVG